MAMLVAITELVGVVLQTAMLQPKEAAMVLVVW